MSTVDGKSAPGGSPNGFMTPLNDGARLTAAYALGAEPGEWLQQATVAIRACVSLEVLSDVIQPVPELLDHLRFGFQSPSIGNRQNAAALAPHAGADGTDMTVKNHRR